MVRDLPCEEVLVLPRRVLSSECCSVLLFGGLSLQLVRASSDWLIHNMLFPLRPLSSLGYTKCRNIVLPQYVSHCHLRKYITNQIYSHR